MRLIDGDALLKALKDHAGYQRWLISEHVWEIVENQPTAYDVDKVVEELLENIKGCHNTITIFDTKAYVRFDKALDIVRRGGVDG